MMRWRSMAIREIQAMGLQVFAGYHETTVWDPTDTSLTWTYSSLEAALLSLRQALGNDNKTAPADPGNTKGKA